MTNADVVRAFEELADLMEIAGEDGFRVNSYRRVARGVDDLAADINDLAARGELATIPGVGKGSAEKIAELLKTGKLAARDEVAARVPVTLLELLQVPHLGPKKAAALWRERNITDLAQLKHAIASGGLQGLKGFGDKTIQQLAHGIDFLASVAGRVRLGSAWPLAVALRASLAAVPGVTRAECAGSLRRGRETIGDLDLLCTAADGAAVVAAFTKLPGVKEVLVAGDTKGSALFEFDGGKAIQVDLRVVPAASFGAAWMYFTGSKEHNIRLRERAIKRGWSLNEYGLTAGEKVIASQTEEDIYAALDLPWLPPEMREDRGELELTEAPGDLLSLGDIRGDLHMHTTASDGRDTIDAMIAAAKARGYEYICITEHSKSSVIANGLTPERLRAHIAAVRAAAQRASGITVWVGAEVDILAEGALDYDDAVLAPLDFVIASVHAGQSNDVEKNTRRTLAAIRNPYVNLVAHPTGRLINKREAMPLDVETLAKEAARTGTALEINASSYRLDLKDQHARMARDLGATICIDTDAHSTEQLDQMPFGVMTARRAWLRKGDVLNTRPAQEIAAFVRRKRA